MITRQQVIEMAQALPDASTDTPFENDFNSTVLRHTDTNKWFGLMFKAPCRKVGLDSDGDADILNLKCDPLMSYGLFQSSDAIMPAYHMNKYHWISVRLSGDVPMDTLRMLMRMSYDLTAKKPARTQKSNLGSNKASI